MKIEHSEEYSSYYSFVEQSPSMKQHGILGMHWGVRRWQNEDGSLTAAGRKHYDVGEPRKEGVIEKVKRTVKRNTDEIKEKGLKRYLNSEEEAKEALKNPNHWKNQEESKKNKPKKTAHDRADDVAAKLINKFAPDKSGQNEMSPETKAKLDKWIAEQSKEKIRNQKDIEDEIYNAINKYGDEIDSWNKDYESFTKNLTSEDLEYDHDGYTRRKDGKPFEAEINGKTIKYDNLEDLIDELRVQRGNKSMSETKGDYESNLDKLEAELKKTQNQTDGNGYSKNNNSPLKSSTNDELKKEFQENPYTLDDLSTGYEKLWKEFGLSKNDLYITDEGHVSRKDNKPFIYEERYHDGTIVRSTSPYLDGLPNFWDDNCKVIDSTDYKGPSASQLNGAYGQLYDSLYRIRDGKGTKNGKPIGLGSKEAKAMTFVRANIDKYLNSSGEWIYKNKQYNHADELIKEIAKNGDYAPVDRAKALKRQGLTIEQIAKKLGIPNGTVSSYLYG